MQCTREQIEAKRKLALQKLAEKKSKSSPVKTGAQSTKSAPQSYLTHPEPVHTARNLNAGQNGSLLNNSGHQTAPSSNYSGPQIGTTSNYSGHQAGSTTNYLGHQTGLSSNYLGHQTGSTSNYSGQQTGGQQSNPQSNYFKISSPKTNNSFQPYDKQRALDRSKPVVNFFGKNKVINGSIALISDNRFSAELSGFSTVAIDVMKTIPTRFFDPKTKNWNFHLKDYELFQSKFAALKPDVVVGKLPQFVLNCCRTKPEYNAYDLQSIDSELLSALMPFQEEGVCFGIEKNGRCLIGDDMGLGKTFQALAIASYYKNNWPLLIVTTSSMKNIWEETIYKYLPTVPIMKVQYMVSGKDYIEGSQILIVSHDLMSRCLDKLQDRGFGVIIIDESHVLKNFKTKCTKAATELCKRASRVILLSGTPALSRPSELYTQLSLIDDRFFGSFFDYSTRYCNGKQSTFGWDSSGQSNLQELEIILAKRFMIRRTKEDVLKSLPNKIQEVITLDVNLEQFSKEDRECLLALAAKYNLEKKDRHAALLTFFAETAKIKIPSVCSYILQVLETGKKFLVFAHHQKMLNAIEQVLVKKKKEFIRIDGNTTSGQRKFFVDKFQLNDNYVCALLSITAANAGITLTAAHLVLFAELHWNPSILSQAEARAHRIGQEEQVTIQYLLAPGTSDDSIWPMLQEKQKTLKDIGLMGDSFRNVSVKNQSRKSSDNIRTNLNNSITSANTLDITSYFISPKIAEEQNKTQESVVDEFFNDNMDDVFGTIDLDF